MKKLISLLILTILILAGFHVKTEAYVRLEVKGINVNIRDEAGTNGNILTKSNTGDIFIAEDDLVTSTVDKTKWYKIIMSIRNGYVPLADDDRFGVSAAYIRSDLANMTKITKDIEKVISDIFHAKDTPSSVTGALKDIETGMTIELSPIAGEEELRRYENLRFGYAVNVPYKTFTKVVLIPDNGDGIILESNDGESRFRVSGGHVINERILRDSYDEACRAIGGESEASFIDFGSDYWEISCWAGNKVNRRRFIMNENTWSECEISFTSSNNEEEMPGVYIHALQSLVLVKK